MSKYVSKKLNNLTPYTPGEQPQDKRYVKLNTNESPFPPSPLAVKMAAEAAVGQAAADICEPIASGAACEMSVKSAAADNAVNAGLNLYSDPEAKALAKEASKYFGVNPDEVIFTNGSDEALFFAVMAFCDENTPLVFADITYGCYPVFADACGVPKKVIPLTEDFRIEPSDYFDAGGTVFIANPNAPTGIALTADEIRAILDNNRGSAENVNLSGIDKVKNDNLDYLKNKVPDRLDNLGVSENQFPEAPVETTRRGNIVLIDEAYVDFGAESVLPLIHEYDNLIVTQTFSKSRSLAGARLGMAFANPALFRDLNTIKFSFNPYNVNRMTMAAGIGALRDDEYVKANMREIEKAREWTSAELTRLGFISTNSKANFIFAKYVGTAAIGSAAGKLSGREIYERLKEAGVLVRHFDKIRIADYIRITVGSLADMEALISALEKILN